MCVGVNLLTRRKVREFCRRIQMTVVNELDCTTIKSQNSYEGRLMHNGFRDKGLVLINSSNSWTQSGNQELSYVCVRLLNKLPFKPWSWWSNQWSPLSMEQSKTLRTGGSNVEGGSGEGEEERGNFSSSTWVPINASRKQCLKQHLKQTL
jgi:hypothetical protein